MSLTAHWKSKHDERRQEFAALVQSGRTQHGVCRTYTADERAAFAAERGAASASEPVKFIPPTEVKPRPKRKVIVTKAARERAAAKAKGPRRARQHIRERTLALFGDRTLTVDEVRAAMPEVGPASIKAALAEHVRDGALERPERGVYRVPRPGEVVRGMLNRKTFLMGVGGEPLRTIEICAVFPQFTSDAVLAALKRAIKRGEMVKVRYGVYQRGAVQA